LAKAEGLAGHAASIQMRLDPLDTARRTRKVTA